MKVAFIHGFILALGLILPLGVQNLFVLQQGLLQPSLRKALPAVITAAVCDTVLIVLSVGGISMLLMEVAYLQMVLISLGSCFLFYMGWQNWHSAAQLEEPSGAEIMCARQQMVFAMSVSLLNPYAFLDIMGVIGTSSLQYAGMEKISFALAAILVSWLWFSGLSILGHSLDCLPDSWRRPTVLQRFSAIFMWGSGGYLLWMAAGL